MKKIKTLKEFNEELEKTPGNIILKFGAPWCAPCKALSKDLEEIHESGQVVLDCNIEEEDGLIDEFNIRNVPTVLIFNGGELKSRISGRVDKEKILEALE